MNSAAAATASSRIDAPSYRDNLPRHLIALSRYLQSTLMQALKTEHGHRDLRMHFGPVITLVGERGARVTELAEQLAISKQAANQAVNQIEAAGYLQREPDPSDGRAKLVVPTNRGLRLMEDGAALLDRVETEFQRIIGEQKLHRLTRHLGELYRALRMQRPSVTTRGTPLGWLLPRLSDLITQQLMQLTRERGHPGLKLSFAQVLTLIGPGGGQIQSMARINGVSKQAIGAVANELETLGYLRREQDPADARQRVLLLTSAGERLLEDSVAAVAELDAEYAALIGSSHYASLRADARELYLGIPLEGEAFPTDEAEYGANLAALAESLQRQLGGVGCRALGQLLMQCEEVSP